jgi:hypothetical protein
MCSSSCVDRKRKDPRQEGVAPSGFSRFPAAEGDSDDEDDYEKERKLDTISPDYSDLGTVTSCDPWCRYGYIEWI